MYVGLFAFSFAFSNWNACSIGLSSGDWQWVFKNVQFLWFNKLLGCILWYVKVINCIMKEVYYEALWCSIWLNLGRISSFVHFRIHPVTSISTDIINNYQLPSSIGSHTCFVSWTFLEPYLSIPIILVKVNLGLICQKNSFTWQAFVDAF